MRRALLAAAAAFALGLALWARLQPRSGNAEDSIRAWFEPGGALRIEWRRQTGRATVYDAAGRPVALALAGSRGAAEAVFRWIPGAEYRVVDDRGGEALASAPAAPPLLAVRLHAPLGQAPRELYIPADFAFDPPPPIAPAVSPGETLDLMLEVEKRLDGAALPIRVSMEWEDGASARAAPFWRDEARSLELEFDKAIFASRIEIGEAIPAAPLRIRLNAGRGSAVFDVRFVPADLTAGQIEIAGWRMPVDAEGRDSPGQPRDQLAMPNPVWSRLSSWLGLQPEALDYLKPFCYQAVDLRNRAPHPVTLLVRCAVLASDTKQPLAQFEPPRWDARAGLHGAAAIVEIPPGEARACVLPIHIQPGTAAGDYIRRLEIGALGSDRPLIEREGPLGVVRSRPFLTIWTFAVAAASLAWLGWFLASYRRLARSMGARGLTLLALMGALQFCLELAGGWVSSALYALLGPFNCLVGGFLTELLTYLIVTTILYLVPRVGAMTLAGVTAYLMGAMLFGSFGVIDLLFTGSAIAFREAALWGFGVTRRAAADNRAPRLLPMMLALGLSDALSAFTSLSLMAVFYRLFYAPWYIALNVGITGFLYTCIGVWVGRSLGQGLRRVRS